MDIFVCYSFKDNLNLENFINKSCDDNVVYVDRNHLDFCWKIYVKRKIVSSDCVLCLITKNTYQSNKIAWELQTAKREGKKLFYLKYDKSAPVPIILQSYGKEIKTNSIFEEINEINEKKLTEIIINDIECPDDDEISERFFEQYKIMVGTSEELGKRRQAMHRYFVVLNGVFFSALGLTAKNITNFDDISYGIVILVIFLSIIGFISAYSWEKQTISYKQLSSGKFKVINKMEEKLPASIFLAEWHALAYGKDKKVYSAFTQNEKYIPQAFMFLYGFLMIVGIGNIVYREYLK